MTPGSARLVLGCVAIVASSVAAAYVLTDRQARPITQSAPPPPPPPTPVAMTFQPLVQSFSLVRDSAAYVSASQSAPQLYPLVAGTGVVSASRSADGSWIIAMTQDGQAAYIPTADLGAYDPSRAPQPAAVEAEGQLDGHAHVVNTATLVMADKTVPLAGLLGKMGRFATELQSALDAHSPLACVPAGAAYTCTTADGTDVGHMALSTGLAEAADDANADYRQQESVAREAHLGLWK